MSQQITTFREYCDSIGKWPVRPLPSSPRSAIIPEELAHLREDYKTDIPHRGTIEKRAKFLQSAFAAHPEWDTQPGWERDVEDAFKK